MRLTKAQREAEKFRLYVLSLLAETGDWDGYDAQQLWLQKLVHADHGDNYTAAERAAVDRIAFARRLFSGWDGYSVSQLLAMASPQYVADLDYEDEVLLKELVNRKASMLRTREMGWLVGLCRFGGLDIRRFDAGVSTYGEAA